jgi:hypothetical protein
VEAVWITHVTNGLRQPRSQTRRLPAAWGRARDRVQAVDRQFTQELKVCAFAAKRSSMSRNAGFATASSGRPSTAVVSRSVGDARQERQGFVGTLNRCSAAYLETDDHTGQPAAQGWQPEVAAGAMEQASCERSCGR